MLGTARAWAAILRISAETNGGVMPEPALSPAPLTSSITTQPQSLQTHLSRRRRHRCVSGGILAHLGRRISGPQSDRPRDKTTPALEDLRDFLGRLEGAILRSTRAQPCAI